MATILIVDDDVSSRKFLVTLLGFKGYRLLEASDGAEALALVQLERPDLVIADILMPTMDGYEFVRRLRADPLFTETRVIFFSGNYYSQEALALARTCGVLHVLDKPASPGVILQTVEAALSDSPSPVLRGAAETFDREHLRLVTNRLAHEVQKLEAVNAQLAAILELSQRLTQEHDLQKLLETFCREARAILSARYAALGILDASGQRLSPFLICGVNMHPVTADRLDTPSPQTGILGQLLAGGRPLRLRDISSEPDAADFLRHHPSVRSFLGVPIATEGRPYGLFCVTENIGKGEFGADAERVAMTLTAQLAVAYENLRRYDEIQEHAAHLTRVMAERKQAEEEILASRARLAQLSRQLIATQENERRHLARELHDEIGQILTAVFYNLNALKAARDSITLSRVDESLAVVDQAIQQVRNLSLDLRPSMLDDHGLAPTIKWYVDRLAQQTGLTIHLTAPPSGVDMLPEVKIACFRVAQEAMTNVVRHARAKQVWIELNQSEEEVRLDIRDDGIGFDVAAARGRALRGGSVGLLGMQERVELVSGQFVVESRPGRGTTVLVRFDVDKLEEKRAKIDTSGGVNDEAYPDLAGR